MRKWKVYGVCNIKKVDLNLKGDKFRKNIKNIFGFYLRSENKKMILKK